ncbi:hypothetical protein SMD11_2085 [Streptomyces albireticuli]|uniref:Type I restriction modification DNA specificity domain-containing protein n=1 Tax=Streptomyces albireticuli TaxID=1940 RepID=A0A1Z2L0B3_9ACTN|nr:hypothetical protein SMD11_2085 [Streptomyces albireticuli]
MAAHAAIERRITALERVSTKLRTVEVALVEQSLAGAQDCVPLESWLYRIETGKSPAAENVPAGEGEWGVLKVSAVQSGWFEARENKVVRDAGLINPHYEVQTGDLLMTRANTEDLVGLACVVQSAPPRLMLSDKTLRLVTNESMAESSFIQMALASPGVRNQIKAEATGTSGSMKNISQAAIRRLLVPNVAIQEQQRVTAAVASSRMRMDSVRRQIAKLRAVRQGLLDDLLSGRARVPQG